MRSVIKADEVVAINAELIDPDVAPGTFNGITMNYHSGNVNINFRSQTPYGAGFQRTYSASPAGGSFTLGPVGCSFCVPIDANTRTCFGESATDWVGPVSVVA